MAPGQPVSRCDALPQADRLQHATGRKCNGATPNTGGEAELEGGAAVHKHQKNPRFGTDAASTFLGPNPTGADLGFRKVRVSVKSRNLRPLCDRKRGRQGQRG